ncbi:MAG: HD domain-containing protein [Aliifodinibius sp.]|nr:HD domain-containing protein [Fodinibius sp.]NIV15677.1 HD domain-containing protein [Fodinibius sp.]NIV98577.1 HD domain-containing protein [Candidatus Saccharibacteria bacterium]NIY30509.1 HD domain-containing protein [Fodinibius sp.]
MHPQKKKAIYIPVRGEVRGVDVHDYLPIIDHPHFQRLRGVKQLGQVSLIYPAAVHNRFTHSIGTLQELIWRLEAWQGQFDEYECQLLKIFALTHDIGHPAFSHATERVVSRDHKEIALVFLKEMKEQIERCNIKFEDLVELFNKMNPIQAVVGNHPMGVDKFDYLDRDSRATNMDQPNLSSLDGHVFWLDDRLVIDDSHDIVRKTQRYRELYISSYGECYLRKGAAAAQRVIEKMWGFLLDKEVTIDQAIRSTDDIAFSWFLNSEIQECRDLAEKYRSRTLPKAVVVFRMPGCKNDEPIRDKSIRVFEASREMFQSWEKEHNSAEGLTLLEAQLEELLELDAGSIIIAPQFHAYRYSERPIWLKRNGMFCEIDELYRTESLPAKELGRRYTAWRICVMNKEDRQKVCNKADLIREFLMDS